MLPTPRRVALPVVLVLLGGCGVLPGRGPSVAPAPPPAPLGAGPSVGSSAGASSGTGFAPEPSDLAGIDRLLGARARAVRRGDEAAFMATVDDRDLEVVEQQRTLVRNLLAMPLDGFAYSTDHVALEPAPVRGAAPTLRLQTIEHVDLADTFTGPVGNEVDMTYVRRDGRWLVGRERQQPRPQPGEETSPRPWFGGAISVVERGGLVVLVDAADTGGAPRLADVVEQALGADADLLGLPLDEALLVDATGNGEAVRVNTRDDTEAAAVFTTVFDLDDQGHPQHLRGGAVLVNPAIGVPDLADDPGLVRHELTHFLLRDLGVGSPIWLTEGIAEYARWYPLTMAELSVTPSLWAQLQASPRRLPVEGVFQLEPRLTYLVAQAAVQHLISLGGPGRLLELMRTYRRASRSTGTDLATPAVLRTTYGISEDDLVAGAWANLAELHH